MRRFGHRIVRSPVAISVEPTGPIEMQSRAEVVEHLKELTNVLLAAADDAWPARASALAS